MVALRTPVPLHGKGLTTSGAPRAGRQLGNFPQAFSHLALANTARNLSATPTTRPAAQRSGAPVAAKAGAAGER